MVVIKHIYSNGRCSSPAALASFIQSAMFLVPGMTHGFKYQHKYFEILKCFCKTYIHIEKNGINKALSKLATCVNRSLRAHMEASVLDKEIHEQCW